MEVVLVHKVKIETERLVLRDLEDKDAPYLREGLAPIEVAQYLGRVPHPYVLADAEWFINKSKADASKEVRTGYPLAITLKPELCLA